MRAVGEISWKKCADIAAQLRCIVKLQRFDLFKSVSSGAKPNGGTVSPWRTRRLFNFNSPDYDEELHVTPYANDRCEIVAAGECFMRALEPSTGEISHDWSRYCEVWYFPGPCAARL